MSPALNSYTSPNMLATVLSSLTPVAVFLGVVFMTYNNYRSNTSATAGEALRNYETLVQQIKDQKTELEKKMSDLAAMHSLEINELHRQMGEKDSTIKTQQQLIAEYKATIDNRNPELENTLKDIRNFMSLINEALVENKHISAANSEELHQQTSMLKDGKKVVLTGEIVANPNA